MPRLSLAGFDRRLLRDDPDGCLVGVDEVGRGAWAGPVVAAAVRVDGALLGGTWMRRKGKCVADSKTLSPELREELYGEATALAEEGRLAFAVAGASVVEIAAVNVVGATCVAMARALGHLANRVCALDRRPVSGSQLELLEPNGRSSLEESSPLACAPESFAAAGTQSLARARVLVDGKPLRALPYAHEAYVQGDGRSFSIALASILAKVVRDRLMAELGQRWPAYGWARNKGYGVPAHVEAIRSEGPCDEHRAVFLRTLEASPAKAG